MKDFLTVNFKGKWRPYQERVLNELKGHLLDKKLHVVAAPGSGKTILGLEAVRRIGKKALILAPSITIREQWISRFESFYLSDKACSDAYITSDLKNPQLITVVTYQGLHAAYHKMLNEEKEEDIETKEDYVGFNLINTLKKENIETIVLDEAHHLRTEWWKSLTEVITKLGRVSIISLTATPPYDVSAFEWDRYQQLCGEIDSEITVPELVYEKNLCPHQDYVYFNYPTEEELKVMHDFKRKVNEVMQSIINNQAFKEAILKHPYMVSPEIHMDKILDAPEYYTNMLVYLHHIKFPIPKKLVSILGHQSRIPKLSVKRMEQFLNDVLYRDLEFYEMNLDVLETIKKQLSKAGCIHHRKVSLISNEKINKMLVASIGKLNSIKEIVKSELDDLKDDLKLVILTDYIRKETLPKNEQDQPVINQIGVVPIFETLRRENIEGCQIGVVSGGLILLPNAVLEPLRGLLHNKQIDENQVSIKPLAVGDYFEFELKGENNRQKVNIVSILFRMGHLNVLIGTKSLLGEGWDEPSINTLILASFVGSYMLSNQMRGRAIRIDANNPHKTANIWHLVCVENDVWYQKDLKSYVTTAIINEIMYDKNQLMSEDYDMLRRRFKSFVGVHYQTNDIENGIDRLSIIAPPFTEKHIQEINREMLEVAKDRDGLRKKWTKALQGGTKHVKMIEETTTNNEVLPKKHVYLDSISFLAFQALSAFVAMSPYLGMSLKNLSVVPYFFGIAFLGCLPYTVKSIYLLYRYGSLKNNFKGVTKALLDTLMYLDLVKSPQAHVYVEQKNRYEVSSYLINATSYEKNLFVDSLEEIIKPIENPRYLIERRGVIKRFKTKDYIAVPKVIGKNKEGAQFFSDRWKKYVGPNTLIYTRDVEGRKELLRARVHSLSYQALNKIDKKRVFKNKWQ